jgi:hypothetical protein
MPMIAPVKVNVEAVDKVTAPIRRIQSTLGGLRSKLSSVLSVTGKVAAGLAALGTAAAAASVKLFTSFVERAGEINDAAQRIGVSAETLQELRYSAEQAGVSTEVLGTALQKYLLRPGAKIEDVTGAIAESMSKVTDASLKLRAARELFGRGGAPLIPWLDQGAGTIAAQMKEARDLGLVIGNDAAANADELGDRFSTLTKQARGISDAVAASITPDVLRAINELIVHLARNRASIVTGLTDFARDLLDGAKALVGAVPDLKVIASDFALFARAVGPVLRGGNDAATWLNQTVGPQAPPPWIDLPKLMRFAQAGAWPREPVQIVVSAEAGTTARVAPGTKAPPGITIKESWGPSRVGRW